MKNVLTGVLIINFITIACSTSTNKKMLKDTHQAPARVETKINTSSSAAKANEQDDSAVVIKPVHKSQHQKKLKIK